VQSQGECAGEQASVDLDSIGTFLAANMLITDAQVHLWEPDRPGRPWPGVPQRPPHRPNGFSAEEMLAEMDAAGVDRAVVVPPTWVGDNNQTALEAAAKYPERFAVVGRFNVKARDAREQLNGWLKRPHMLGIRATFHTKPYIDWLDDGSLDWYWDACERLGIPVMALVPGMVRKLLPIAEGHRELKILIPHMGCRLDSRGAEAFSSLEDLVALARYPRVFVMLSSAPNYSNEAYPFRDLQPFIKRIFDAYGPGRLLWGADLSRLTSTYSECLDHVRNTLDFLGSGDKEWMLGKSLAEVLNWPESGRAAPLQDATRGRSSKLSAEPNQNA
jgi:predicted TIM-barrel fold metal-dependent hydrolase